MKKETKLTVVFIAVLGVLNVAGYVCDLKILESVIFEDGHLGGSFVPLLSGLASAVVAGRIIKEN